MGKCMALIVGMILQACTYPQTDQAAYIKCHSFLNVNHTR